MAMFKKTVFLLLIHFLLSNIDGICSFHYLYLNIVIINNAGAEKKLLKELKGLQEFHPSDGELPQPMAWQGKPRFRSGANRRKRGCHYFCRRWPVENCRVQF